MPRGRKTKVTEPQAEGSPSLVKELLEVMEMERTRQMEEQREQEERCKAEHNDASIGWTDEETSEAEIDGRKRRLFEFG